jgi:hypothetical protein
MESKSSCAHVDWQSLFQIFRANLKPNMAYRFEIRKDIRQMGQVNFAKEHFRGLRANLT